MATNYTTKTASLKATQADIRKVEATKIMVSPDGKSSTDKVDILGLISDAQDAAVSAAGIHVGTETSMVKGGENGNLNVDADKDGSLDAGVPQKVKGMNFCGNVAVVNNADGTVDFWFMNPDNHSKPTSATTFSGLPSTKMYVYDGTVNTDGITKNTQHSYCVLNTTGSTLSFTLKGSGKKDGSESEWMAADNKISKIKVYVLDGDGSALASLETPAICEASTDTKARGGKITGSGNGITITITDVTENKVDTANGINDAQLGYTPGYVRFKGSVSIATKTIIPTGGTCKAKVVFLADGKTETTLKESSAIVYAYQTNSLTAADAPSATLTYNVTKNKTISGITYDSEANATVTVTGIKGTQRGGAHANAQSKRAYLSDITESAGHFGTFAGDLTTELESGTSTDNTAVFKATKTVAAANTNDPARVNITGGATVQTYEQNGSTKSSTAKATTNTLTGATQPTTWLQTSGASTKTTSGSIHLTFTDDGARVLAAYDGTTMPSSHTTWDSTKSLLEGDYAKQLLVQGTSLRYPTTDVTGKYGSATGWRSYVVPVTFGSAKTAFTVTTAGSGTWSNDKIRLYLVGVKSGAAKAQCLSWAAGDTAACTAATGAIGVSTGTATSNGSWSVAMDPSWFPVSSTGQDKYYLVVQMAAECDVKLTGLQFA